MLPVYVGFAQAPPEVIHYPDTIFVGGKIVTMDDRGYNESPGNIVQAMAIRDGRILALGTDAAISTLAGPSTRRISLKGRTVIPGLVNAHTHIHNHALAYWTEQNPRVFEAVARSFRIEGDDFAAIRRNIEVVLKERVQNSPPQQWAFLDLPTGEGSSGTGVGISFLQEKKMTIQELDKLVPNNPVVLRAHPAGIINTAAKKAVLELYGDEPDDEKIDATGFGEITDYARGILVDTYFRDKIGQLADIVEHGMSTQAALGTTAYSSHIMGLRFWDAIVKLNREGRMPVRFAYTHYQGFQSNSNPSAFYLRFGDMAGLGNDFLWQSAVGAGNVDSGPPMICSSMKASPEVKAREWCRNTPGSDFAKGLYTAITSYQRVALGHSYGDKSVDYFMDQLEQAIREEPGITLDYVRSRRFSSDHCGFYPRPDQIPRLARLGMVISCRAEYVDRSFPWFKVYGDEYKKWVVPVKSMLEGGLRVVFEGEIRVENGSGPTLFQGFLPFLTRRTRGGELVAPEEAIDRVTMLKMATVWGSEYILREGQLGTLEKGKLADVVVLNKDYFEVPTEEIAGVYPLLTMVGGKIVVLRQEFAGELGAQPVGPQIKFDVAGTGRRR